jgi:hypothetical protein
MVLNVILKVVITICKEPDNQKNPLNVLKYILKKDDNVNIFFILAKRTYREMSRILIYRFSTDLF